MSQGVLQRSPVPGLTLALSLCGDEGLRFGNEVFVPDATLGYFQFQLSHAFPVATVYQTALHPAVIAKSYKSLFHQKLDKEHQIASYFPEGDVRDHIIGFVAAVDFPKEPPGGWTISDPGQSPAISGVAAVFKEAQGMAKVLGEHVTGKHKYTVSMEVFYPLVPGDDAANPNSAAGFALNLNGGQPKFNFTPPDMLRAGYEYVPAAKAPEELVATFSRKKNRVMAQYRGRRVCVLMGGLDNPVHYAGVGLVRYGAEPPAKILRLAASAEHPLDKLADDLLAAFAQTQK